MLTPIEKEIKIKKKKKHVKAVILLLNCLVLIFYLYQSGVGGGGLSLVEKKAQWKEWQWKERLDERKPGLFLKRWKKSLVSFFRFDAYQD